jgi:hypothetical protein
MFTQGYGAELAANAKEFVYQHYSANRMAAEYTELFEKLVTES